MAKYEVVDGQFVFEGKRRGPADTILVDTAQQSLTKYMAKYPSTCEGTHIVTLPVADYLFRTADGQIVGVEEKRLPDLFNSWTSRRLQRQLRHLVQAVDIPILALRGVGEVTDNLSRWNDSFESTWLDVLKWGLAWGTVGFIPHSDVAVLPTLREWKVVVAPGRTLLSAVTGDDRDRRKTVSAATDFQKAIRRIFEGVGPKLGERLDRHFKGNLIEAITAPVEEWQQVAGVHKGIIALVKRLRKED